VEGYGAGNHLSVVPFGQKIRFWMKNEREKTTPAGKNPHPPANKRRQRTTWGELTKPWSFKSRRDTARVDDVRNGDHRGKEKSPAWNEKTGEARKPHNGSRITKETNDVTGWKKGERRHRRVKSHATKKRKNRGMEGLQK